METKFVYYSLDRARNGEHFDFIRTFLATFSAENATELGLTPHRNNLNKRFQEEDEALKVIQAYDNTTDITALDAERDELFRYITQEVKNQQRSPIAARRTPDAFTQKLILLEELAPKLNANANDLREAIDLREKQDGGKIIV